MPKPITLANGLRVATRHIPSSPSVAIAVFIGAGGRYEDYKTNAGVTHFLEHMLFKGSKNFPHPKQVTEAIESVGGYINAYTVEDRTCFEVKLPKTHWELGVEVLADMVLAPLLREREIERERGAIIEELNMFRDDPARLIYNYIGDLLWPTDGLRTTVIGNEQIISSIKRNEIANYYKQHYNLKNIVVAVTGNLKNDEIVQKITEHFAGTGRKEPIMPAPTSGQLSKNTVKLVRRKTNQSHLLLAARSPHMQAPDEIAMRVLSIILGGGFTARLTYQVREKLGLAYDIYAATTLYTDSGSFEIYAGVNRAKLAQALRVIMTELARIRRNTVPTRELERAKELIKGRILMSQEDNAAVADRLGTQLILTGQVWPIETTLAKIDRVSAADIKAVANQYLQPELLRLIVIGPYTAADKQQLAKILSREE